jgi:hypothetical protein
MADSFRSARCRLRNLGTVLLGLFFICLPVLAHAKNNCPWLNEATASGLLGGSAAGDFTEATTGQPAGCTFTQQAEGVMRTLRITVEVAADPQSRLTAMAQSCGSDAAPLKAIGNSATVCSADERKGRLGERVVGRVRDQVFTITLQTTLKGDSTMTRDALRSNIFTAAEQVSGNLF